MRFNSAMVDERKYVARSTQFLMKTPRALMNVRVAIPGVASGRAAIPFVVLASLIAVGGTFAVTGGAGVGLRAIAAVLCVAAITILFAWTKRLELALYSLVPLMTVVRAEPAPVEFITVGLLGALALRGELWKFAPPRSVTIAFIVIALAHIPALIVAEDRGVAIRFTAATFLVMAIAYVTFQLASRDPRYVERAYVLAAVLLGVQTLIALSPLPIAGEFRMDRYRIEGLFKDPNVFGPFAVPAVALLAAGRPSMPSALRIPALMLALMPIPASLSRGAVIVLVASLLVLAAVAAYRRWWPPFIYSAGILGAGLVALVVLLLQPGSSVAEQRLSLGAQLYDAERFAGQLAGLNRFLAQPLSFGIGPGQYDVTLDQPSHETYLRMLVETGPLSLIALLVVMWASIRLIRQRDLPTVAWTAALIGFAVYGFFIDILHWRHFWFVIAVPLAIVAWHAHQRARPPAEAETS